MTFQEFFYKYVVTALNIGEKYTILNTTLMALLIIGMTYGMFEVLKRMKIKIDRNFTMSFIPFVSFAVVIRVFEDAGIVRGFWFISPGIWILFSLIIFSTFLISILVQKRMKIPYHKIMISIGLILLLPTLLFVKFINVMSVVYALLFFLPIVLGIFFLRWNVENKIVTVVHAFDAVITFVSIEFFNYREMHVLPNFVIGLTGSAFSFIVLKLVVVVSVLLILDRYSEDIEFKKFLKFVIGILGFVPGLRDFLRLIWLV